MALASIKQ